MGSILDVCSSLTIGRSESIHIDFIGKGNVWINNTYEDSVSNLAKYIISEALSKTAPGQLSVVGFDSDLSGIFSPFSYLSAGDSKTVDIISGFRDFEAYLTYLWQHIQSVQNVIQGRTSSLYDFRSKTGRAIESYKLVVLSLDLGLVSNEIRSKLSTLMRKGPDYGVSFLIISTTYLSVQTSSGNDIEISVDSIAPNITILETNGSQITESRSGKSDYFVPLPPDEILQKCRAFVAEYKKAALPTVRFDEVHNMTKMWTESSIDGLTFTVGMYGINSMSITIGDEINQRHNAIITGAVGQGKSNLISMIIHSLCLRYSPKELQMYLLDFKEGVTFKAFSNIGQEEYLPHAKALGLESDPDFGLAVLDSLYKEYKRRMKMLKDYNMKSVYEFRKKNRDYYLPRILVIIDEFQLMFDSFSVGTKIAEMLEKSVRLFRAAGINFILASQTLSDSSNTALTNKKESLFSQVPIRIALKNSLTESNQTLGNPAAAFLRPREAIINLDYGEVTQNKKTVIGFADEALLRPIRRIWWEKARTHFPAPYVFESEKHITVKHGIEEIGARRNASQYPYAFVGERISIDGECIAIPMSNENGRNIAIIGTPDAECDHANGMIQSVAVSLAAQHFKGDARFIFFDFSEATAAYNKRFGKFAQIMENMGYYIECYPSSTFADFITDILKTENPAESVYIFGSGMDKWQFEIDPYGGGSPLQTLVNKGPSKGIHFVGWWQKSSFFSAQVAGFGKSDAFNTLIFLRIDERTVQSLVSPFVRWSSQMNRALVSDSVEFSEESTFIPYAPVVQEDIVAFKTKIW